MADVGSLPLDEAILGEVRMKLGEKIIDKRKAEWKAKMPNVDGQEVEIPGSLDGEVMLEVDKDPDGRVRGWITISTEDLARLVGFWRAGNPVDPTWRKKLDEWKAEGIDLGV